MTYDDITSKLALVFMQYLALTSAGELLHPKTAQSMKNSIETRLNRIDFLLGQYAAPTEADRQELEQLVAESEKLRDLVGAVEVKP